MLFADMTPGDWITIAGIISGGIATGGGALGAGIRFAWNKYAEVRAEDRKHEVSVAAQLTASTEKLQRQAAEDNRKSLDDSRASFATLIEIQRDAIKAVAGMISATQKLESAVNELRAEVTGKRTGKRRPRPVEEQE